MRSTRSLAKPSIDTKLILAQIQNPLLQAIALGLANGINDLHMGRASPNLIAVSNTAYKHLIQAMGLDLMVRGKFPTNESDLLTTQRRTRVLPKRNHARVIDAKISPASS